MENTALEELAGEGWTEASALPPEEGFCGGGLTKLAVSGFLAIVWIAPSEYAPEQERASWASVTGRDCTGR